MVSAIGADDRRLLEDKRIVLMIPTYMINRIALRREFGAETC